jgi:hypothetical protein
MAFTLYSLYVCKPFSFLTNFGVQKMCNPQGTFMFGGLFGVCRKGWDDGLRIIFADFHQIKVREPKRKKDFIIKPFSQELGDREGKCFFIAA